MKEDEILQKMNSKIIFVSHDYKNYLDDYDYLRSLENGVVAYIKKDDKKSWDDSIQELYKSLCKKEKEVSFDEFRGYIYSIINIPDLFRFENILKYFNDKPIQTFNFLRPLYGMKLDNCNYFMIKEITFIKKEYLETFLSKYEMMDVLLSFFEKISEQVTIVHIKCYAKDSSKAKEYAEKRFHIIDICFRFLLKIDNDSELRIGMYNLNYESLSNTFSYCENSVQFYNDSSKPAVSVDKFIDYLVSSDIANRVWYIMDSENLTDIEKRIKEAIIWIAEATHQNEDSIAFMECFLALEAMLMEQDGFINKSITAQISEYVAFILSNQKEMRIKLEAKMKRMYKIRSAIAHGKNKADLDSDLKCLFAMVKSVVVKFLMDDDLKCLHNIIELRNYITNLKFQ